MGQWLRLCTPKARGPGSILGWETGLQSLQTSTETYPHVTATDSICHNKDPAQPNKKIKINVKKNQNTWVPLQFTSAPCHPPVFNMPGLTLSGTNVGSSGQSLSKAKHSLAERECQLRNKEHRPYDLSGHCGDVAILHSGFARAQRGPCSSIGYESSVHRFYIYVAHLGQVHLFIDLATSICLSSEEERNKIPTYLGSKT